MTHKKNNKNRTNPLCQEDEKILNQEQKNHPSQVILLLHSGQLACWLSTPGLLPKQLPIKGETLLRVRDASALASAWEDLAERLEGDGLYATPPLWVADVSGQQWCLEQALSTWQLPWEWLAQRFGLDTVSPWDASETLHTCILPWLTTADDSKQRQQLQQRREHEHANETERLAAERLALEKENEHLRAQNSALQQVDGERLASFLPSLYPRVFTVIGPADLALLCGRIEPLSLPNPYPEPSEETLRSLQKRFRALPHMLQKQIIQFINNLPHAQKLQPRPEIRDLLESLKD